MLFKKKKLWLLLLLPIIAMVVGSCKKESETAQLVTYDVDYLQYSRYVSTAENSDMPSAEMQNLQGIFNRYGLDIANFKIITLSVDEKIDSSRYEIECLQYHNRLRIFPGSIFFKIREVNGEYLPLQYTYPLPRTQITYSMDFPDTSAVMSLREVAAVFYDELNHSAMTYAMRSKGIYGRIFIELGYYKLTENPERIIMAWAVGHDKIEHEVYIDDKTGDVIRSIFSKNYDYPGEVH